MNAYPTAIGAVGWLYGSVYTDGWATAVPGYRTIQIGASTYTIASGAAQPYWFWEWLTALDTAIGGGWGLALSGDTWTLGGGAPAVVTWLDRTGWLLGFDAEPGDAEPSASSLSPRAPSPAAVPLISCERPEAMSRDAQSKLQISKFGRGHGWTYGAADVYRCRVKLDRLGFDALNTGWLLSGMPVALSPFDVETHALGGATAYDGAYPNGYLTGRILGTDGDGSWVGELVYETTLLLAVEVP